MGVGVWVFILVLAHPSSPRQRAVKRLCMLLLAWLLRKSCINFLEILGNGMLYDKVRLSGAVVTRKLLRNVCVCLFVYYAMSAWSLCSFTAVCLLFRAYMKPHVHLLLFVCYFVPTEACVNLLLFVYYFMLTFPSVLWRCWFGGRKGIRHVKNGGVLVWYWLTWVVPEKGPLNGCVCVCSCVHEARVYLLLSVYYFVLTWSLCLFAAVFRCAFTAAVYCWYV